MRYFTILATVAGAFALASPTLALAGDPSETSQHSGKNDDGKTNGMTDESARKIAEQQKKGSIPATEQKPAEPAKADVKPADGQKSP